MPRKSGRKELSLSKVQVLSRVHHSLLTLKWLTLKAVQQSPASAVQPFLDSQQEGIWPPPRWKRRDPEASGNLSGLGFYDMR